jgi:hypothetical protein
MSHMTKLHLTRTTIRVLIYYYHYILNTPLKCKAYAIMLYSKEITRNTKTYYIKTKLYLKFNSSKLSYNEVLVVESSQRDDINHYSE